MPTRASHSSRASTAATCSAPATCTGARATPRRSPTACGQAIDAGIEITHLATQNEPDGHPDNKPVGNYVDHYRELVGRLPSSVKVIAMEWRHPENGNEEFDRLASAGLIGNGNITAGGLHIYNKAALPALVRPALDEAGHGAVEHRDGRHERAQGGCAVPRRAAPRQRGRDRPPRHRQRQGPAPGADERERCRSSLGPADRADRARAAAGDRHARRHQQRPPRRHGRRPGAADAVDLDAAAARHFVAVGKRPDGKWVLAAVSFAFGGDSPSEWAGGHYGGATQQLTVRIAELAGKNGSFVARRCSSGGALGGEQGINLVDGHTRFTLPPGEALTMVGG